MSFISYLVSINVVAFFLCWIDKIKSIKNWYRISENCLIFISFIGGCFGMALGMNLFRHKTKKMKFKVVYLFCILYLIFFGYWLN